MNLSSTKKELINSMRETLAYYKEEEKYKGDYVSQAASHVTNLCVLLGNIGYWLKELQKEAIGDGDAFSCEGEGCGTFCWIEGDNCYDLCPGCLRKAEAEQKELAWRKKKGNIKMLTLEKLKQMPPNTIFRSGILWGIPWVAVRGNIEDWTIYRQPVIILNSDMPQLHWTGSKIAKEGDKIFEDWLIRGLVPCDNEVFKMYRY